LLEYLLAQQGEQVLVAAVPVLEADTSKHIDDTEDTDSAKLKNVATAARVLQVSRNTQVSNLCPCCFKAGDLSGLLLLLAADWCLGGDT
jgi:hypothetical protein